MESPSHHVTQSPNQPESSPENRSITVSLGNRSYRIVVSSNQWHQVVSQIMGTFPDLTHGLVIVDTAIAGSWAQDIVRGLRSTCRCDVFDVPSGEPSKSVDQLAKIWEWMHACRADRASVVIAIGGGVIGDLAGFAAASYARGLRLVQIPTTLLAQVDSSVGGKTGINLTGGKNMVGAFWQPSLVVIDTQTLDTLPDRTYVSGLAEVIKYGVIEDASFFDWLVSKAECLVARDPASVRHAIIRSCEIKAAVVADDERETTGRRAILNYGHTFAHAIEATAGYGSFLHGEAVAIGMQMAARLALAMGLIEADLVRRQQALIESMQLPITWPGADEKAMIAAMQTDKKVAHAKLRFVLPTAIGRVELITCNDAAAIAEAIRPRGMN